MDKFMILDLVTSILGLSCVLLAARKSKYNFWIGYLYNIALFIMFWNRSLYASLMLQPLSLFINIIGHYRWTHPKQGEESASDSKALKVSSLSWSGRAFCIGAVLVLSLVWGWILRSLFPADPHPFLDTVVTVLILTAQLLSSMKKWDCWVCWIIVNVAQMALHLSVGHVFMPIVCSLYLLNSIWALVNWEKSIKKGE